MAVRELDEMIWTEIRECAGARTLALLPIGAIEAHGPHLPLGTDVIIAGEMARRAAHRLSGRGWTVLLLPPMSFTCAPFAQSFPGTLSVPAPAMADLLRALADALGRAGVPKLCLANAHFDPVHVAALRGIPGIVFPDATRRRWAAGLTDEFRSGSCHAGRFETSLLLAARPDLVRPEYRTLPTLTVDLTDRRLSSFEDAGMTQAYCGAPSEATREEGEATFDRLAEMIVSEVLGEAER